MILLLDTSTPICKVTLLDREWRFDNDWEAGRDLAKQLLGYLEEIMQMNGKTWSDITAIGAFRGPGSFTGLRIGLTILNTLADSLHIPIVGAMGEGWQSQAIQRLNEGENDRLVMPEYGSEAHITTPKK
jgi:tRNA threonylcarbamoyladenosine biosynthesis protein TsaB